ncbi:MAG: YihY/virulence factor BrkB family protein [Nitrospirota bacterium]
MSHTLVQKIISIEPFGALLRIAGMVTPYIIVCTAFTFFYLFIPNTRIQFKSALTGGVMAGVLWEITGWAFAFFSIRSSQYSAIYSGFAMLVLFMIWLYLNWLILLAGAQVSFYHQNPNYLAVNHTEVRLSNRLREKTGFLIMYLIGHNFCLNKKPWSLLSLSEHIGMLPEPVDEILTSLKKNSLILETGDDPPAFLPARDIETITLQNILNAVRTADSGPLTFESQPVSVPEVDRVMTSLEGAISGELGNTSLKDIILPVVK